VQLATTPIGPGPLPLTMLTVLTVLTQKARFIFGDVVPHAKNVPGCRLTARRGHRRPVAQSSISAANNWH
jgi:hypothetical protein